MSAITSGLGHYTEMVKTQTERVISVLKWVFVLLPIAAGADKFTNILTDWDQYLSPAALRITGLSANTFMAIVGVIEIAAGIIVLVRPKWGSLIVSFWLLAVVINLLTTGQYYDIAVRDAVISITAFCLYMLLAGRRE